MEQAVERFSQLCRDIPEVSLPVHAVVALTDFIRTSKAITIMQLEKELEETIERFQRMQEGRNNIALRSGCELFRRYVSRINIEIKDFDECKLRITQRGEYFATQCQQSRQKIADKLLAFLRDNVTILVHGFSRTVLHALQAAARNHRRLHVVVTEGLPHSHAGPIVQALQSRKEAEVAITVIRDAAVAAEMADVDFVLVGAEGVVETGGIINKVGTYQVGLVAKALGKPLYVAAESFKFVRTYPLSQADVPQPATAPPTPDLPGIESSTVHLGATALDYTPPELITLLFTDLGFGILTPSAVSDELIKVYHEPLLTL